MAQDCDDCGYVGDCSNIDKFPCPKWKYRMPEREKKARKNANKLILAMKHPLDYIANDLLDDNVDRWLKDPARRDTIGAQEVEETGFTSNQQIWLNELIELMSK